MPERIFDPEVLKRTRKLFFPAIATDIITGYNIYPESPARPYAKFQVSYLHSNLNENNEHRQELEEKIKEFGITVVLRPARCQRVDRTAAYRLEQGWQADEYYDAKGNSIPQNRVDDLVKQGIPIIGVSKQYDLRICIDDQKTLCALLEIFRKYVNAYLINKKTGKPITYQSGNERRIRRNRKHKITDAWEIPFVSVDTNEDIQLQGFQQVKKISIDGFDADISTLIDKKWEDEIRHPDQDMQYPTFKAYLEYMGIKSNAIKTRVNVLLADWLNTVKWERLEQARQVLGNL